MNNEPEYTISNLNDCGCCEGVTVETPIEIDNRPSLPTIAYRIGEHADFKASMLARLSTTDFASPKDLRTRNDNDFSIALLDAWAMVADVLTFYDQTIAKESYLRTASERLSIFELARLIGYKPHPGVAASTLLAFTMDDLPGSPEKTTLSVGTKVQSTPKQDEQAQLFETVEEIETRPAWNNIRPRLTKPQELTAQAKEIIFDGIDTGLSPGNGVLFHPTGKGEKNVFAVITGIELDQVNNRTKVLLNPVLSSAVHGFISMIISPPLIGAPPLPVGNYLYKTLSASDLGGEAKTNNFKVQDVFDGLSVAVPPIYSASIFRKRASIFGHNAPAWESLPDSLKGNVSTFSADPGPFKFDEDVWPGGDDGHLQNMNSNKCPEGKVPFKEDAPTDILFPSSATLMSENFNIFPFVPTLIVGNVDFIPYIPPAWLFLDNPYKEISTETSIVLKDDNTWGLYEIKNLTELTKSCFTITSKVTRLGLNDSERFEDFSIRGTSVYLQSELLPLAHVPIKDTIPFGDDQQTLKLNGFVDGLHEGQQVVLSGMEDKGTENPVFEFITLDKVEHKLVLGGYTRISFSPALKHIYKRETVTINANVAPATHGETVQEVLGSGDATQLYQNFALKQPPLTHVSASTPSGAQSTLEVRVNNVLWHESDRLPGKGSSDRVFVTHINDAGETNIKFGNGESGARLATGQDNVRAVYRKGIGTQGLVDAGQLNMLMSRPLGLKEVTNPLAPTGAADPESRDDAQQNAPLTVMTLDRAVSLQDYEDFSRAFAGIAKSLAISALKGQGKTVFITVAGPDGVLILGDSPVYEKLLSALAGAGDPLARFCIQSYRPVTFRFGGKVKIDPDYIADKVLKKVESALRTAFSFEMREFGQLVALSEVIAVIQDIAGVLAVDVDYLYQGNSQALKPRIIARAPVIKNNGKLRAAELLTLHPGPLDHLGVMT